MGPLDRIARRLVGRARAEALGLKDEAVARVSGCTDAHPGVGRCVLAVAHDHAERLAVVAVEHLSEHCARIVKRHATLHTVKGWDAHSKPRANGPGLFL